MNNNRKLHRLTMHVEGRGGGASLERDDGGERAAALGRADFEKVVTTDVRGDVSRLLLFQLVCDIMCAETLLHENSQEVASMIGAAVELGSVADAPHGALLPLVGRDTSANLQLAVSHTLEHGNVKLALGVLSVAVDGARMVTSVSALRMDCELGAQAFCLSAQLTPKGKCAHCECFRQDAGECTAVQKAAAMPPVGRAQPGTLSHYNHRLNCQQEHARNLLLSAKIPLAEQEFSTREVLSRKVARISTQRKGCAQAVHTVFFR